MRRTVFAALALCLLLPLGVRAQEMPTARKWTNVEWYGVLTIKFRPAQREAAVAMWHDKFAPAAKAAGAWQGMVFLEHMTGGQWDVTLVVPMPEGPSEMEWEIDPNFEKFIAALAQQEGEAAVELGTRWEESIMATEFTIALLRKGEM